MKKTSLLNTLLVFETPAFLFNPDVTESKLGLVRSHQQNGSPSLLFPLKAMSLLCGLDRIALFYDGFAASSVFEAMIAKRFLGDGKTISFTSPGLRENEVEDIAELCDFISFNSFSQLERFHHKVAGKCKLGLRVNTELSLVEDKRFDPSRIPSKLGVPLSIIGQLINENSERLQDIKGLLIHSNCESEDFGELLATVKHVESQVPALLDQIEWINLGGGYLFDESTDWKPFEEAVKLLSEKYGLKVFFEPGRGVVGHAGYIISSVLDVFDSGNKRIAVLDTTVNHMPEVFEYQWKPPVAEESPKGQYSYILAGASCLAGDIFGEYSFDKPLEIGSRLVFEDMGAYTLVKSHMFNGINLPSIYMAREDGEIELIREFDYQDFLSKYGVRKDVAIRERVLGSPTERE